MKEPLRARVCVYNLQKLSTPYVYSLDPPTLHRFVTSSVLFFFTCFFLFSFLKVLPKTIPRRVFRLAVKWEIFSPTKRRLVPSSFYFDEPGICGQGERPRFRPDKFSRTLPS
jgi:hypothetical protein